MESDRNKPVEQYIGEKDGLENLLAVQKATSATEKRLRELGTYKILEASLQDAIATLKEANSSTDDFQALASFEYVCLADDFKRVSDPKRLQNIADHMAEMNGTTRNMEKVRDPDYIKQLEKLRADSGNIDFKKDDVVTSLNKQIKNLATAKNSKDASPARREYYQARIDLLTNAIELYREEINRLRAPESVITKDERKAITLYEKELIAFTKISELSNEEAKKTFRDKNPEITKARDDANQRKKALEKRAQLRKG